MGQVNKGDRVVVRRMVVDNSALSGMQPKCGARAEEFEGVVVKIRGDHPVTPTVVAFDVQKDDGTVERVRSVHVVGVVKP